MEVDYKGDEVTVDNFMRLLTGRHGAADGGDEAWPLSRRLLSGNNSRVFLYMTGHGGDEFLKFHNHEEISSDDLVSSISILFISSCARTPTYLHIIYIYILSHTGQCLGGNA
jgi:phosphatidylinositol glycan class K